jgi:hypothetical protein
MKILLLVIKTVQIGFQQQIWWVPRPPTGTLIQTVTTEGPPPDIRITSDWTYTSRMRADRFTSKAKWQATRRDLDDWMKALPQPWTAAVEATIFTGWIYDHLKPHPAGIGTAPVESHVLEVIRP